jgi:hypothetical protein
MKFLVIWRMELSLLSREMAQAVGGMAAYGATLESDGKVVSRWHVVGAHGGAWIYDVGSHEEFERLARLQLRAVRGVRPRGYGYLSTGVRESGIVGLFCNIPALTDSPARSRLGSSPVFGGPRWVFSRASTASRGLAAK